MSSRSEIHIHLEYKVKGSVAWESIELTNEAYFETLSNEAPGLDSLPKYEHAIDYLNIDHPTVQATRLLLQDPVNGGEKKIHESFWNNGQNRIIERLDLGPQPYWEMIIETRISDSPEVWEIMRLGRQDEILTPWYHGFIRENEDGSETETKVDLT